MKRKIMEVWRGGRVPSSRDEMWETVYGTGKYDLAAHVDRNTAAQYGKTSKFEIDATDYLDATTPEGAKVWQGGAANYDKLRKMGYKGVIFPDTHDWDFKSTGPEVVIFDPQTARFRFDDPFPSKLGAGRLERHRGADACSR